jgi:hypothetical protein
MSKRTDEQIVTDLRRKVREVAVLCKEARDRGIRVAIWDKGNKCINVIDELDLLAEKVVSL